MARFAVAGFVVAVLTACGGGGGGEPACPAGQDRCGDACVDLATDEAHCGACATSCAATQVCAGGACGCQAGLSPCGTSCVDLSSSAEHCGACGTACLAGAACTGGLCHAVCSPPEVACGLACADLSSDAASCGRCGRACAPGATCAAGACAAAACPGLLDLPGAPLLAFGGEALAAADLDGDGLVDLVAASNATVAVALGLGTGRFAPPATLALPPGAWASAVRLADLDGDGWLDLLVADRQGAVHVFPGQAGGAFGARASMAAGAGADGLAVADLDGDGLADLAVSAEGQFTAGSLTVFWDVGVGATFDGVTALVPDHRYSDVAIGDLDRDGRLDLVASEFATGLVSVFPGEAGRSFGAERLVSMGGLTQAVALADLDGDQVLDLVTSSATPGTSTSVALGDGAGGFAAPTTFPVGGDTILVADVDGDGHPDVALATGALLLGDGAGGLAPSSIGAGLAATAGLAAADLDLDGRLDLAFGGGVVALRGPGRWLFPASAGGDVPLDVGDVDGDLDADLVGFDLPPSAPAHLSTRRGLGDGTFGAPLTSGEGSPPPYLGRLGDLDGDGRPDLVTFDGAQVRAWLGDGAGRFAAATALDPGAWVDQLLLADVDGDGRADLLLRLAPETPDAGGQVVLRLGAGAGSFGAPGLPLAADATALAVADLDGDGHLDLLTGSRLGLSVEVRFGAGDGTFSPPAGTVVGEVVTGLAAGDLDGDGVLDLVVTAGRPSTPVSSFAARLPGLGGGALGVPVRFLEGWAASQPLLADLTGDGRPELLAHSDLRFGLVTLRNAGDGGLGAPELQPAGGGPLAAADLDRDGLVDVVCGSSAVLPVVLRAACRP